MNFLTPQQSFPSDQAFSPSFREKFLKNNIKAKSYYLINPKDESSRVVLKRNPIHHEDTSETATVSLDVAGFTIDDINIQVEDHIVCISAKRKNKLGDVFHVHRRFRLDEKPADEEGICATITDGVLQIVVQKKKNTGPRVIPISSTNKKDKEDVNSRTNKKYNSKDVAIKDETEDQKLIEAAARLRKILSMHVDSSESSRAKPRRRNRDYL